MSEETAGEEHSSEIDVLRDEVREAKAERHHRVNVELLTLTFSTVAMAGIASAWLQYVARCAAESAVSGIIPAVTVIFVTFGTYARLRLTTQAFDDATDRHNTFSARLRDVLRANVPTHIPEPSRFGRGTAQGYVVVIAIVTLLLIWDRGPWALLTLYLGGLAAGVGCAHTVTLDKGGKGQMRRQTWMLLAWLALVAAILGVWLLACFAEVWWIDRVNAGLMGTLVVVTLWYAWSAHRTVGAVDRQIRETVKPIVVLRWDDEKAGLYNLGGGVAINVEARCRFGDDETLSSVHLAQTLERGVPDWPDEWKRNGHVRPPSKVWVNYNDVLGNVYHTYMGPSERWTVAQPGHVRLPDK